MNKLLRYTRITLEVIFGLMITALLVDYTMGTAHIAGWLARIQFLPACLSMSFGIIAFWFGFTLIFGRVYCSTVCPLGTLQDLIARMPSLSKLKKPRRLRRDYAPPHNTLRYAAILFFIVALSGSTFFISYIDPYTVYSRMAVYLLKPVYGSAENMIAELGEFTGLWTVAIVNISVISVVAIAVSAVTLAIIAVLSVRYGRLWCNTICPVGAVLGKVSRYSIFHIDIDTDKCIQCRKCVRVCKSQCIDLTDHVVDTSRCVTCFDCTNVCPNDAITYTTRRKQLSIPLMQRISSIAPKRGEVSTSGVDTATTGTASPKLMDRRKFLTAGIIAAAAPVIAKAADKAANRIDPLETGSVPLVPSRYVTPPGSKSRDEFLKKCTGCGLCVSHCTSQVLRPASGQYGSRHMMVPVMDFTQSWCYYNCKRCTTLCPTGALHPLTRDEKHRFVNGLARVDAANCISAVDGTPCGACAKRCPTEAITMQRVNDSTSHVMPVVDPGKCIGCGACEYICPAAPFKAIVTNGNH